MADGDLLQIAVLGRYQVAVAGRIVPDAGWRSQRAASLIKLLAITRRHQLHRDQIIDALWPAADPDQAAGALHRTLYVARRILQPALPPRHPSSYLSFDRELLMFDPAPCRVDWVEFAALAAAAARAGDPALADQALALFAGDLLPGDPYAEWAMMPREALRGRLLRLLLDLAAQQEELGRPERAISYLRRAVTIEATAEAVHAALIRLDLAAGQPAAAETQFRELSAILRRALGTSRARSAASARR